jgi:hypothetical protein
MDSCTSLSGIPDACCVVLPVTCVQAVHLECDEIICCQSSALDSDIPLSLNGAPVKAAAPLISVFLLLVQCLPVHVCLLLACCVVKIQRRFKSKRRQNQVKPAQMQVTQSLEGITDRCLLALCEQFNSQWERTMKVRAK